ncbi:alpha-1,2-fucosyltransferase [Pedobacter sp. MC2016-14]|uniref:alpha-1,2-fucosyltransferase n=1 Tax=Pedobacter sp. MC2016-14 TaxID=2897327 RepID=UPI001E52D36B|nr:alpha-1,2-fucosyltransferase [Pedobacter sp. MC2016-14]MCD0486891.1 alpha-1,2-fucosyltransferase [Pedobacter sp. MC2016-14]
MNNKVIVYPKLHSLYHFIIRFRGAGLANCLFMYARALVLAERHHLKIINPSWLQFNIGPYLRKEKDKRHYNGLFKSFGIQGFSKHWLLLSQKMLPEDTDPARVSSGLITVQGLGNYFKDLTGQHTFIKKHLLSIVSNKTLQAYQQAEQDFIGLHIRLGDYDPAGRVSIDWYLQAMALVASSSKKPVRFFIFSDGLPEELEPVLNFPNTVMAFYGNAIADILVLSKAKFIIASDSTFSAWGAYLGQVPVLFFRRHFPAVLDNSEHEWVYTEQPLEEIEQGIIKVLNEPS